MLTSASIDAAVGTVAAWQATPYALAPKPGSLLLSCVSTLAWMA